MKIRALITGEARTYPKYCAVLFLLVVFVLIVLHYVDINEFQQKRKPTMTIPSVSTAPETHQEFCTFNPLSRKDAQEERLLLDSIAWPETPSLSYPVVLEHTTDPAHSTFTILPGRNRGQWHVGDRLEVIIKMYDFNGFPKKSGGDVLVASLHNQNLEAGAAGQVVDHLNGSYSAVFSLLWEGNAQVEVMLVHPSEAVTVLRRLTREQPDRITFQSHFRSGSVSQTTTCNVCLRPNQQPLCNYTDAHTGDPWFCYKPTKLNCDTRINHSKRDFNQDLKAKEETLFQSDVNMKVLIPASGPASVTVLPQKQGQSERKLGLSGYYYKGVWRALSGPPVRRFESSSSIRHCLKDKQVHLYGDSTIRQLFEHFTTKVPDLKEFNLHNSKQVGPFMALDFANNILMKYRCHGPPIRFTDTPVNELRYIANELDGLIGGSNTVVVIGIWSHFSTFPVEIYVRRLLGIRRAVVRLLDRSPGTLVVIRTANLKGLTLSATLTNSDWYSLQRDKVLRAVFKGLNVRLIDGWEMSLAHSLPHNLHPQPPIITNMIDVLLSYICPNTSG